MKRSFFYALTIVICVFSMECGSNTKPAEGNATAGPDSQVVKAKSDTVVMLAGINSKGIGRFHNIQLTHPLDEKMVADGQKIFQSKCFACHKLTSELLVGPGWA